MRMEGRLDIVASSSRYTRTLLHTAKRAAFDQGRLVAFGPLLTIGKVLRALKTCSMV